MTLNNQTLSFYFRIERDYLNKETKQDIISELTSVPILYGVMSASTNADITLFLVLYNLNKNLLAQSVSFVHLIYFDSDRFRIYIKHFMTQVHKL